MSGLIASEHVPRLLEQNKDEEAQEKYIVGKPLNPSLNARAFFNSASPLVRKGNSSPIVDADIWRLDEENTAGFIWSRVEPEWEEERKKPDASLFRVFRKVIGKTLLGALGVFAMYGMLSFVNPVMLPFLITYVNDPNVPAYAGYIYVICSVLGQLVASFCYYNGMLRGNIFGIRIRSAMISLVYRKSLTMAPRRDANTGQVVNLISSDALFIADTMNLFLPGITAPIQIICAIIILAVYIGYYVVITVGMLAIALPIAAALGRRFGTYRLNIQKNGDRRLKLTNELLQGIRIVKYYAWENAFRDNIEANRDEELKSVLGLSNSRALLIFIMRYATVIAVAITLITYSIYVPGGLTQSIAYLVFSVLSIVQTAFILLPVSMSFIGQYLNSFGRVQNFISQPDIVPVETTEEGEVKIVIENGEFTWPGAPQSAVRNVTLNAKKGDLVMVVGSVGSGKSSLISAMLSEVPCTAGTLKLNGSLGYAAQEAFIFNSTVRENIIFGKPFDMQKYQAVLEASALMSDLAQFTAGDQTEIGERGVNLSGGQKQRIAIARALYADADIVLMDDPLSAVDAHVSKHLFEKAVQGMLKDKLVVLATNQLQYLPFASDIIFLQGNEMVARGKFAELIKSNAAFAEQMHKYGVMSGEKEEEKEEKKEEVKPAQQAQQKTGETNSGLLIKDEQKQAGLIGPDVYSYYIKKGGVLSFIVMLFFFVVATGARVTSSWWISQWTSKTHPGDVALTSNQYIGIYGGLIGVEVLFALGAILMSVVLTIRASKKLHYGLLSKVVRAPTSFFDTTPLGRILNRFSKELDLIDSVLPLQFFNLFNAIFILGSIFASMAFASPYMLIPVAALIVGYFFFNMYFTKTYMEIQRQEALSRAPMFSRLGETLRGAATIRAYKMENVFRNLNNFIIDTNSRHRFAQVYVLSWYGLRLDALGAILILILLVLIVTLRIAAPGTLVGPFASLALSYTSSLTSVLSLLNSNKTDTEARLNSVERIKEYDLLPQEAPEVIEENRPPKNWPEKGDITFKNVSLRYSPQGEKVLNDVTVDINGEEKVGIVGRTGAGKSTMLQALFRLVELAEGSIEIDGIDISTIGLRDLRSKISIIPQEPVLFLGTVRYNLDPFNEHSDVELWEALKMVNLSTVIEGLTGQLDAAVEENGSNFSVGQRQLICMARALLRKTKILVMDEATASVDLDTDMLIQTMVRRNFATRTSLTIAHRLNTVMDSTKVMVLNRGQLVEYDKPINLLNNDKTIFHSMVQATGPEQAVHLTRIANGEIGVVQSLQSLKEISMSEASVSNFIMADTFETILDGIDEADLLPIGFTLQDLEGTTISASENTGLKRKFSELENHPVVQRIEEPQLKKQKATPEKENLKPRTIFNSPLGHVEYYSQFIERSEAIRIRDTLIKDIPWEKEEIVIYGKKITAPRLVYSFGDEGVFYRYSGTKRTAAPWHAELLKMKQDIEKQYGDKFNFALVNYYRDGTDYIGFHSDKEGDLVAGAPIASVSLGAERDFILMSNSNTAQKHTLLLQNGSLLFMRGNTQKNYKHSVPKSKVLLKEPRINITFRMIDLKRINKK